LNATVASVTYDGQSFSIDGRRVWVLGAGLEYARIPAEAWAERIAAARQAGFNTVDTSCPWLLHEPRKGRFCFQGQVDVKRFVQLCGEAGMWVILRPGPFVGHAYDAGGLPSWLLEAPGVRLREANEPFLERVSLYFRKLLAELSDLQATNGGPILLVQSEHAWLCANAQQADRYLREVTRFIRESGFSVPVINANDLWPDSGATIDTWRGADDLLVHLRQLRSVQPNAPRLVSEFQAATMDTWGSPPPDARADALARRLAQVLAAGAQPVVSPFCGGSNFGFLGGRLAGRPDAFVTTAVASDAPLGETGERGPGYLAIKRLMTFANHFGHVFADLDPDYHPVTFDIEEAGSARARTGSQLAAVPLRGAAGRVVFVFAPPRARGASKGAAGARQTTLVLEQGIRLPVDLGDESFAWYLFDVDLRGSGRLDYANLCPSALVDRSVLVLHGPARSSVLLSLDGSPLEATVPAGQTPLVLKHKRATLVICNTQQIDTVYHDLKTVYVGAAGLDADGTPRITTGALWAIGRDGEPKKQNAAAAGARPRATSMTPANWRAAPATDYAAGKSPRYATLDGPQTLTACGAPMGYGWYRLKLKSTSARKRRWHLPESADRVHLFLEGKLLHVTGFGRGADHAPFDVQVPRGESTLVCLVDNLGRFGEGNDLGERKGLYGHIQQVKRLTGARGQVASADPVDPFVLRGYIAHRALGQLSESEQVVWTFQHARATPILVEIDGLSASGTLVLNGTPVAYYAGQSGARLGRYLLSRATHESFRRGRNELRFAPDTRQNVALAQVIKATTLSECTETPSASAAWAFAKWEPPTASVYKEVARTAARSLRGVPCWWRGTFEVADEVGALMLRTAGLSKGQAFVNGNNVGRYFTATADGRAVGPQDALHVPGAWINADEPNEIVLFDEHGFAPDRVRLRLEPAR
jgi:beta-galactosidase